MALDFPSSPTDGQIYGKYYWNNTAGVWQLLSDTTTFGLASNTPTGSYTDGADYEYVSFTASGTLTVTRGGFFDANAETPQVTVVGYTGGKRYVRVVADFTGTHSNGTPIAASVIKGHPIHAPT